MSLLRDALRKAERAQEEARQQAGPQPLALEPAPVAEPLSLQEFAELSVPKEIDEPKRSESEPDAKARIATAIAEDIREPDSKLSFYFALSALAAVAAGAGGYFWLQLRAPSPLLAPAQSRHATLAAATTPASKEPLLASTEQALASLPKLAAPAGEIEDTRKGSEVSTERPLEASVDRKFEVPADALPRADASQGSGAHPFSLGNRHARNGQWGEAQRAFARAVADDPENPDFAFNLAVSHDRLRERSTAIANYRRALALREKREAQFSADAADERIRQLAR